MSIAEADGVLSEIKREDKEVIDRFKDVLSELEGLVVSFNGQEYESTEFGKLCEEIDSDLENDIRELRMAVSKLEGCIRNPRSLGPGKPLPMILGYNAYAALSIVEDVENNLLEDIEKADYMDLKGSDKVEQSLQRVESHIEQENIVEILRDIITKSERAMVESEDIGSEEFMERIKKLAKEQIDAPIGFRG